MSGRKSRSKGQRREREFAKLIEGRRIPLSGAQEGFENDVEGLGIRWEVKARKNGFQTLYKWLEDEREAGRAGTKGRSERLACGDEASKILGADGRKRE